MAYAKRVDDNQSEIITYLRCIPGITVMDLSAVGAGCPDIAVGFMGRNYFFEIKDGNKSPSRRTLTKVQSEWHSMWRGQARVIICVDDILETLGI
jgi:hypothetical protein